MKVQKYLGLSLLVILVVVLSGCATDQVKLKTVESTVVGLSLQVPEDWVTRVEQTGEGNTAYLTMDSEKAGVLVTALPETNLLAEDLPDGATPEEYIDAFLKTGGGMVAAIGDAQPLKLGEIEAAYIPVELTGLIGDQTAVSRGEFLFAIKGERAYLVIFNCDAADWEEMEPLFVRMMKKIKVLD